MIIIAFDIDQTLYINQGDRQVPNYDLIQVARWFHKNGDKLVAWSAGGMEYTQVILDRLGLSEIMRPIQKGGFGPVPLELLPIDLVFDDQEVRLGKVNCTVRPNVLT